MKKIVILLTLSVLLMLSGVEDVQAYIGPGAGFAFISSFFILLVSVLLAIMTILFWPLSLVIRSLKIKKRSSLRHDTTRIIIVGLDGLDPDLATRYMQEGKLPNLSKISNTGTFKKLRTTLPPISPVAWSTFTTGVDPSRHNIFDFLNRDLRTYLPELSSTKIETGSRSLSIGKYSIPLGKPSVKLLRKGKPFWSLLGKYGIFSAIIRVPITYPPEKLGGVLLSGMCVPDLKGTQGTFTSYTSGNDSSEKKTGGVQIQVKRDGDRIKTYIPGPDNSLLKNNEEMRIPLNITINGGDEAVLEIPKEKIRLKKDTYSPWVKLTFRAGPGVKIRGICRFYIKELKPDFDMYMTPINIDPESPSLPISSPYSYSVYLAKIMGSYATLGLAEDTWALNERVIDEDIFLEQAYDHHEEREAMLFNALDKTKNGLCVCVFDTTDRIQHMFMRFIAEDHPAHAIDVAREAYADTIEQLYIRMDEMIGRVMKSINKDDVLMVISDHGFKQFKRGVNLNSWLYKNGYLALKDGKETGDDWFRDIDWENTRAYTFGLSGIYINEKGREAKGVVSAAEKEELKAELISRLRGLPDDETGGTAIKEVYDITEHYDGPYRENGPDLIIGYNEGYRASWGAAVGSVNAHIFEDNNKSWSGDHCMDPSLVPGVFFCNRNVQDDNPHIKDIAPTVLDLFGVEIPPYMNGKPLISTIKPEDQR